MIKLKKFYRLIDLKYPWLLLISMITFTLAVYFNKSYPEAYAKFRLEVLIYGASILIAVVWSILNYMSHLKINSIYKKHDNIKSFVGGMAMNKEEKLELEQYLNDFVKDLIEKGDTQENAVKKAISQFQVKEFTSMQHNDIFEKPTHFYLLGYLSIFVGFIILLSCLHIILPNVFILSAMDFTFILFSIAFFSLFFLYKLIDIIISKK